MFQVLCILSTYFAEYKYHSLLDISGFLSFSEEERRKMAYTAHNYTTNLEKSEFEPH